MNIFVKDPEKGPDQAIA